MTEIPSDKISYIHTFVGIAKCTSEGPSHFHITVLQVLQHQVLNWYWLPIHLVRMTLISSDRPS